MKIRSVTCFLNPGWPLDQRLLTKTAEFISAARLALHSAGYTVQTARLATVPFSQLTPNSEIVPLERMAVALEEAACSHGIEYVSLGPALPENPASYQAIPAAIAATQNVFLSGVMTTVDGGVSLPAVRSCAEVIHEIAPISPDGFANLRFAALANVPGGSPFFPAAYFTARQPAFALALEAADLAVEAASGAASLGEMRLNLINAVESHAGSLSMICQELAQQHRLSFQGLDFTLAPFPEPEYSIGTAIERMGVPAVGLHGSLAGIAFIADTLDRADFHRAGFNGVMLPVLEDFSIARRAAEGKLDIKDLLLFSAVCGTGLDTLPLPGDITVDQLYALMLDLAALAMRLDKPLTARLMPIPGKASGDLSEFDFAFFANSRVLPVQAQPLEGLLSMDENLYLKRRS
jgi:uncharacterized protein (UPF0210 family)